MKKNPEPDQSTKNQPKKLRPKVPERYEGNRWTSVVLLMITVLAGLLFSVFNH